LPDALRTAIAAELDRAGDHDPGASVSAWAAQERARFAVLFAAAESEGCADVLVRRAALACAPLASLSGAWLQWMSEPGNAEEALTMRVLSLFADDVGAGHPRASRGSAYLALLQHLRLAVHAHPVSRLAQDRRIADQSFYLPAVALTMSRLPDAYQGEIIGLDLCLREVGMLPPLDGVQKRLPYGIDWVALDPGRARTSDRGPAVEDARGVAAAYAESEGATAIERGFAWAFAALRSWCDEVYLELDAARDPAFEMAELVRSRAREASAYHDRFVVQGRSLQEWLAEARTDPNPFLAALADSRLVRPGRSEASRLTTGLVSENGPMFRVFPDDDLDTIKQWIDALPADPAEPARWRPPAYQPRRIALRPDSVRDDGDAPADTRQAYTYLLRRTITPATRRYAMRYVEEWLARSRHGMNRSAHPRPAQSIPAEPPADGLRPWLLDQHDRHNDEFRDGLSDALPERAELIDSTLQLAPLTLIDGAWLAGHTDYQLAAAERGHFLFATYWDELGNGDLGLNHPLIYRTVLREMGVDLPPTRSPEFARWPGFRDRSFALPVYWLAIGRFPRTFEAEILGLNLAMELSGVGGSYRRARQALKAYGFSTVFVDIHNTIDNVATGHSAWAADAIDGYLAQQAPAARAGAWDRIRAGYRSLNPPTGFWARNAARRTRNEAPSHV
jgi:hypothetical protein